MVRISRGDTRFEILFVKIGSAVSALPLLKALSLRNKNYY